MLILLRLSIIVFFLSMAGFGGSLLFSFQKKLEQDARESQQWYNEVSKKCAPKYLPQRYYTR